MITDDHRSQARAAYELQPEPDPSHVAGAFVGFALDGKGAVYGLVYVSVYDESGN
jgi:hypothetical protein